MNNFLMKQFEKLVFRQNFAHGYASRRTDKQYLGLIAIGILFLCGAKLSAQIPYAVGEWKSLYDEGFQNWSVGSFSYEGSIADGGSYYFTFKTTEKREFSLLVANVGYWTKQERDSSTQVFFLVTQEDESEVPNLYKIQVDSDEEGVLLRMFTRVIENPEMGSAEDLNMLKLAVDHLESRKVFSKFPP